MHKLLIFLYTLCTEHNHLHFFFLRRRWGEKNGERGWIVHNKNGKDKDKK